MPRSDKEMAENVREQAQELAKVTGGLVELFKDQDPVEMIDLVMRGLLAARKLSVEFEGSDKSFKENIKTVALRVFDDKVAGKVNWPGPDRIVEKRVRAFVPRIIDQIFEALNKSGETGSGGTDV